MKTDMQKKQFGAWAWLVITALGLLYCGNLYRAGGFTPFFALHLALMAVAAPVLTLKSFRRLGTAPAWMALALDFLALWLSAAELGAALLFWAVCCGSALAVTLFWPSLRKIRPMACYALPASGAFWMLGILGYCRLHFGRWELGLITERIGLRYGAFAKETSVLYKDLYAGALPQEIAETLKQFEALAPRMGFTTLMLAMIGLFGTFFIALWLADRAVPRQERWLGSWQDLVPKRGISWLYMGGYLFLIPMLKERQAPAAATFYLFGFFFVFTAVYRVRQWARAKGWAPLGQGLLVTALFALAFFSVGGAILSPYGILLTIGWWIATAPKRQIFQNGRRD